MRIRATVTSHMALSISRYITSADDLLAVQNDKLEERLSVRGEACKWVARCRLAKRNLDSAVASADSPACEYIDTATVSFRGTVSRDTTIDY